jgi:hypothetical protein
MSSKREVIKLMNRISNEYIIGSLFGFLMTLIIMVIAFFINSVLLFTGSLALGIYSWICIKVAFKIEKLGLLK